MTVKLTVLYGHPEDADEFERHYRDVHLPLAQKLPGVQRIEMARVTGAPGGGESAFHRIAEIYFESADAMYSSLRSEEGRATSRDMRELATGGVQVIVCELDDTPER